MIWQDKRVVVTGGAGFIGSHLVDLLRSKRANVSIVDDLSRGKNVSGRLDNVDLRYSEPVFPYGSIVFHLAAKVTGIHYNRDHNFDMMQQNLAINWNVSEAVRKSRPALYVCVSTACVYPHNAPVPTPESAGDIGDPEPTNFGYGVAKWVSEQQAKYIYREYEIPTMIVRFFNAFGPRDYYDNETSHVAPALIKRVHELEEGEPLAVWGTGLQSRALVDARDIANALLMLAENKDAHNGEAVNIGHEQEITINGLASMIMNLSGKSADIVNDRSMPDGYPRRAADTTKLRSLIGWVPDMPIETTLRDMIAEFQAGRANL